MVYAEGVAREQVLPLWQGRLQEFGQGDGTAFAGQIPIVQVSVRVADEGVPAAVNTESIVAQSFLSLAQSVVTVVNRRNARLPKTKIVEVNNK